MQFSSSLLDFEILKLFENSKIVFSASFIVEIKFVILVVALFVVAVVPRVVDRTVVDDGSVVGLMTREG